MKKLPKKRKFVLKFLFLQIISSSSLDYKSPTNKKKIGCDLNGTNIWDSSLNGCLSNLSVVMVISLWYVVNTYIIIHEIFYQDIDHCFMEAI